MKNELYQHQQAALATMIGSEYFALFCEQGTGKTVILLAELEALWENGEITGALVIAPNGVHRNWISKEIPEHLSIDSIAEYYKAGSVRQAKRIEGMMARSGRLKVLAIGIDSVNTKKGLSAARRFLHEERCVLIVDESTRIKNPDAARTKKVLSLRDEAAMRRIATGRPITRAPQDLYTQLEFLRPGLAGTRTYRAFVAKYCQLLPRHHPLVQHIVAKSRARRVDPQVIARDDEGRPLYRNLDHLRDLVKPFSFSVKKEDCLDLPPKIYKTIEFELTPQLQRAYNEMVQDKLFTDPETGNFVLSAANGGARMKLQQITSGFINHGSEIIGLGENPRLAMLKEIVTDIDSQFIVWARFVEEIRLIGELLESLGISFALHYGATPQDERERIIKGFQAGEFQAFVANPATAGIGLTLTAAETAIYYSNDDDLEHRIQSEDRCHRIGTREDLDHVLYIDIAAAGTVDVDIAAGLQQKLEIGDIVIPRRR